MTKPAASSNSLLNSSKRPTQKPAVLTTNYYITSNTPHTHTKTRPEASGGYITSADAAEVNPTIDPLLSANNDVPTSTISTFTTPSIITTKAATTATTATTSTTASKVIRGRIPWNRLFGSRERERILGRLRRPFITQKTTTTTTAPTTTTIQTTTPAVVPTVTTNALAEPETLSQPKHTDEGSFDEDYTDLTSADFELPTSESSFQHLTTTTSSYHTISYTTPQTLPASQSLPSPPTVKPPTVENPDEAISSGSGGLPDDWFVVRQRPGGTRGRQGHRRRPFRGRRPFKKQPTSQPKATTTVATTMESITEMSTLPQKTVMLHKPLYTPSRKEDRTAITVSTDQMTDEIDFYEIDWSTSSSLATRESTKKPVISSDVFTTSTTFIPSTTEEPYTTKSQRNNGFNTQRPPKRRIIPTVQSSHFRDGAERGLTFDIMTILTAKQRNTHTPAPHNNVGTHSTISNLVFGNEATSANNPGFEATTKATTSKPKIVGGNAASFTVLSNSDAFLPCDATGLPQPSIAWKRFSSSTGIVINLKL